MKNKILWFITMIPMIITLSVIKFIPDKVPMHSDLMGNIDRWGSKYENFIFPVIIIVLTLFWQCFLKYYNKKATNTGDDKEKQEALSNSKVIYVVAVGMAIMFGIMHCFFLYSGFIEATNNMTTTAIDINQVMSIMLGIFFIVIGYFMPRCKPNSVVGLRTTWSMENEKTWEDSNRFGGRVFIVCGILTIIEGIFIEGFMSTVIMLVILIIGAIISVVYTFKSYKKYVNINNK